MSGGSEIATLSYTVQAIDGASGTFTKIALSAEELSKQVDDLARKRADIKVGLDDLEGKAKLKDFDLQLTKLKTKVTDPEVSLKGLAQVFSGIGRADVALDRFGAKHVTATVDVKVNRSGLRGLLSGQALSGLSPEGGGGGGALGGLLGPVAIGGGIIGAGLVPGAVGLGIGGLAGAGAIAGGLFGASEGNKILKADTANITHITTALKTAIGKQKQQLSAALQDANKQYAKDSAFYAPFIAFQKTLQTLAQTVLKPLQPIMKPLTGLFAEFGKGLTALGPQFTALFKASLPFIGQFLKFMLQAGKILLPAFTQAMTQMVKSGALPLMMQGLVSITKGLAAFIVALGPGMKASAEIFARLATFIGRSLSVLGTVFSFVAKVLAADWSPGHLWDILFASARAFFGAVISSAKAFWHALVSSFGTIRHDIATVWDLLWRNTIGRAQAGVHDAIAWFDTLRHSIATHFDTIRHDIASAWDTIWRNTKNAVTTGISAVVGFFRGLPGRAVGALSGLGTDLYNFAHQALVKFGNGAKAVWSSILSWFSGLPKMILHALGIKSPPDWAVSAGKHIMQGLLHGLGLGSGKVTSFAGALSNKLGNAFGTAGPGGGAPAANAALARALYGRVMGPADWAAWNYVAMRESGWNQFARNPTSGAYGIAQALPESKYPFAGTRAGGSNPHAQITWMWNYMAQRYGGPQGAAQHERQFSWYGSGFHGWFDRPTMIGVGDRGRERVDITPGGGGGGGGHTTVNINVNVPPGTNKRAVAQEIADVLLHHTKAGGRLYPQGVKPS